MGILIDLAFALAIYLLIFVFVMFVAYLVIRRAVKDGILDARATVKNLEDPPTSAGA